MPRAFMKPILKHDTHKSPRAFTSITYMNVYSNKSISKIMTCDEIPYAAMRSIGKVQRCKPRDISKTTHAISVIFTPICRVIKD